MRPESQENQSAEDEHEAGDAPEVERHLPVVPEGNKVEKRFPVSLDNIKHRVELEQKLYLWGQGVGVPENWGKPEGKL